MIGDGIALVVIAFDGYDGNACILQSLKTCYGMVHCLRVNVSAVEEVSGDEYEVNAVRDGVILNDVVPGAKEIFGALFQIVAAAAQMYICKM